jgi:tRNA (cytidine32/uridine32-2'-O)-methyltransferase
MKTMGLSDLVLVNPETYSKDNPNGQARAMAVSAVDILEQARVVTNLTEALVGCQWIYGTSARERALEKPLITPREAAMESRERASVAILFGREASGLTNEELSLCHKHIIIPTAPGLNSLNLAAAVQIIAYEFRMANLMPEQVNQSEQPVKDLVSAEQLLGFYDHLQNTLTRIGFIDPRQPKQLMMRMRRLFNRAELDKTELNILRGILSQVDWIHEKIPREISHE